MLRPEFVRRKLELIVEELGRMLDFKDVPYEELVDDYVELAAVERILERIVNRAIDVNEHLIAECSSGDDEKMTRLTYRDTFLKLVPFGIYEQDFALDISKSAGLHNILVHEYNDVDHKIVHGSIAGCIRQYQRYVEAVSSFIARTEDDALD